MKSCEKMSLQILFLYTPLRLWMWFEFLKTVGKSIILPLVLLLFFRSFSCSFWYENGHVALVAHKPGPRKKLFQLRWFSKFWSMNVNSICATLKAGSIAGSRRRDYSILKRSYLCCERTNPKRIVIEVIRKSCVACKQLLGIKKE